MGVVAPLQNTGMGIPEGGAPKAGLGRAGIWSGVQRRSAILGSGTCQGGNGTESRRSESGKNLVTDHRWGAVARFNK